MTSPSFPKCELHLHLDCSLSFDVVRTLDPSVTRERFAREFVAPPKCPSLVDYLERAVKGFRLMQDERALRLVVADLASQLIADGVVYAEARFAPHLHRLGGLTAEEVVAIVDDEAARQSAGGALDLRIILCTLRHFSRNESLETAHLVEQFRGRRVVALDIAGDEAGFPIDAHLDAFRFAIEHGLHRTSHAGEARGPASVWDTLEHFQPTRIGHGVRSSEDPALVAHLAANGIHLELCPTSNVQTNAVGTYASHPIAALFSAGVPLSVNTDCRTISDITLTREYAKLRETFGWSDRELRACNLAAVEASFADEATKQRLREIMRADAV